MYACVYVYACTFKRMIAFRRSNRYMHPCVSVCMCVYVCACMFKRMIAYSATLTVRYIALPEFFIVITFYHHHHHQHHHHHHHYHDYRCDWQHCLQVTSDILMKARKYEEMAKENVEARLEVKAITLDNQKLKLEVDRVLMLAYLLYHSFPLVCIRCYRLLSVEQTFVF